MTQKIYETIVIGGGQAGLSMGYFLKRHKIDFLILDEQEKAGGSWLHTWDSLRLFSPVEYSSLSGWGMPKGDDEYPVKMDFVKYLQAYEERYQFPVKHSIHVVAVQKENNLFKVETNYEVFYSKTVVSATGTAQNPFIPSYPNAGSFKNVQMHSSEYMNPNNLKNKKVLIVGERKFWGSNCSRGEYRCANAMGYSKRTSLFTR